LFQSTTLSGAGTFTQAVSPALNTPVTIVATGSTRRASSGDGAITKTASLGSFNGARANGQIVSVPANSTTYLYLSGSAIVQTGSSLPAGAYGIAIVVSGEVLTGTLNLPNNVSPGILSITDIRT
jgi:hypothetical protein